MAHVFSTPRAPPGYAAMSPPQGIAQDALELFIPTTATLLALDQLLLVQPNLYLYTDSGSRELLVRAGLLGCGAVGWLGARRTSLASAAFVASVGVATSGPARFWAFFQGETAAWIPVFLSGFAMLGLGASMRRFPRSLRARLSADGIVRVLLHPYVGAILLAGLCAAAVLSNLVGTIRASLFIAGGLAAAGILALVTGEAIVAPQDRQKVTNWTSRMRWFGYTLLAAYAVSAFALERGLPLHRVVTSSHPIVGFAESERCSLEVSSGQGAYHVFVDGELRVSTFDERRWAESMVLPALARVRHPKHALVLSTGEGLLERELLKDAGLESITSVSRCRLVPDVAQKSAWFRRLTNDSLSSPRVSRVERDPAAYVASAERGSFDIIIVDLPDPSGPRQSKYYSRYFYQRLAARMHDDSILVVQATSARRSPRTFATIGATLRAAGFALEPAVVPLISRGEWNLYFATKQSPASPLRPEWLKGSLAATMPEQFYHPWPDTRSPAGFVATPSTLYDSSVLYWFERESENPEDARPVQEPAPGGSSG